MGLDCDGWRGFCGAFLEDSRGNEVEGVRRCRDGCFVGRRLSKGGKILG